MPKGPNRKFPGPGLRKLGPSRPRGGPAPGPRAGSTQRAGLQRSGLRGAVQDAPYFTHRISPIVFHPSYFTHRSVGALGAIPWTENKCQAVRTEGWAGALDLCLPRRPLGMALSPETRNAVLFDDTLTVVCADVLSCKGRQGSRRAGSTGCAKAQRRPRVPGVAAAPTATPGSS